MREQLRKEALRLRKTGLSYNEIRKEIPVAKSTLSLWLKSVRLPKKHRDRLYKRQISILSLGSQIQKMRRAREVDLIIREAKRDIQLPLSLETYRLMGAALYWGEGCKSKGFNVTNSDPRLIFFMVKWIERIFGVPSKDLRARLNIYPQQNELKIKKFWSLLTGIPLQNFGKSYVKPLSKGYKANNLYYGTMRVELPKGTDARYKIYGWIQAALQDIESRVTLAERKWSSLKAVSRPVNVAPHSLVGKAADS